LRDHDYGAAADFLARFFGLTTEAAVEIRELPNEQGAGPNRPLFTRDPNLVLAHCVRWDQPERAVYFAPATRQPGAAKGDREHCVELPALWVDIDVYKLGIAKEEAVAALLMLPIPPGILIDSGGGIHAYWLLREAIAIGQDEADWQATEAAIVSALKQLAGVVAGDLAVCDLARIMRLPGTHNTKTGELRPVFVLDCSTWERCEFSDIVDMLDYQRPLIEAPLGHAAVVTDDNPYLAAARMLSWKPSVDIAARLSAMIYLGDGEAGIHATQLSVSASLVAQGEDDDEIVTMLLAETQRAAGPLAPNWNWTREEAALRRMVLSAKPKFAPASRPGATIHQLRGGGAEPRQDEAEESGADRLPEILTGGGRLTANIDEAERHLIAARPPVYQYGDLLVRVAPGPIIVAVGHQAAEVIGYRTIEMRPTALRDLLGRHINFFKFDARTRKPVHINCPMEIAEGLAARQGQWNFPALRGIVSAPVIRADNSILDTPGYDTATGLFLAPSPAGFPFIPRNPTKDDAFAALQMLEYPLRDMPFVDDPSRSVAISAILTGLDRAMMNFAPIHAFDAPQAGSGKGLICNYCAVIAIGHEAGAILAADDPAETDKTLGAKIIAGHSIILLDNVTHALRSALLAQITSEPIIEPRILGKSQVVTVQNTVSILINGNNLALLGDLPRRALKCRLDARTARPELRTFLSEHPLTVAKRDRSALVCAGLTILLAYRLAGSPSQGVVSLGTFDEWNDRVRNALLWLGMADPVATQESIRAVDRELDAHEAVMAAWLAAIPDSSGGATIAATVNRLIEQANEIETSADGFSPGSRRHPELYDALLDIAPAKSGPARIDAGALGYLFRSKVDQVVGGLRLERAGKNRANQVLWRIARV
jgi:hypothetical protein